MYIRKSDKPVNALFYALCSGYYGQTEVREAHVARSKTEYNNVTDASRTFAIKNLHALISIHFIFSVFRRS